MFRNPAMSRQGISRFRDFNSGERWVVIGKRNQHAPVACQLFGSAVTKVNHADVIHPVAGQPIVARLASTVGKIGLDSFDGRGNVSAEIVELILGYVRAPDGEAQLPV